MIAETMGFALRNLPAILFVMALALSASTSGHGSTGVERLLAWALFLPIGITGLWAGISHVFFPATAAAHIGWQVSPFQFEVGMADLAIGITACVSFWSDLSFKAAAVCAASIFLLGEAIGHIREVAVAAISHRGMRAYHFTWTSSVLRSLKHCLLSQHAIAMLGWSRSG
jgi:hypothetical protein